MNYLIKKEKINILHIVLYFIISGVFGALFLYNLKMDNKDIFSIHQDKFWMLYGVYSFAFVVITGLIGVLLIFLNKCKELEFHKKFFILALVLGMLYMSFSPFYTGSDEMEHFFRIYEVANGNFVTPVDENGDQGSSMPTSLDDLYSFKCRSLKYIDIDEVINMPLNKDVTKNYTNKYPSSSVYSPLQYLPQILGVKIGIILNLNVYFIGMIGRFFGFIFWLLLCTYAIKVLPKRKMFISLVLLNPISISFATTLTGDMMTNSIVILFISYIFNICYNKRDITKKDIVILSITSIMIAVCKIIYAPIILVLLLLPKKSFKSNNKYYLNILIIIGIAAICSLIWFYISNGLLSGYYAKSDLQKEFLLHNPIQYILICLKSILYYFGEFITSITAGPKMYHANVKMYPLISILLFVNMVCVLLGEKIDYNVKKLHKWLYTFIIIAVVTLTFTALYIQVTAEIYGVAYQYIKGIQSRYFIPLLMLSVLFVTKKRILCDTYKVFMFSIFLHLPVLLMVFTEFII